MKNIWIFNNESAVGGIKNSQLDQCLSLDLAHNFKINFLPVTSNLPLTQAKCVNEISLQNYQLDTFLKLHQRGLTTPNDHFLFTDGWNIASQSIKYVSDLQGLNWVLHGIWISGSYDSYNQLNVVPKNKNWIKNLEKSFYYTYDHNYAHTIYQVDLINDKTFQSYRESWCKNQIESGKMVRGSIPINNLSEEITPYVQKKLDVILFPYAPTNENQIEIFNDIAKQLPQYEFVVCQNEVSTKEEYYKLLGQSKIIFSAGLQNTLGIEMCAEGPHAQVVPLAPDRLSYGEIFSKHPYFLYNEEWTKSYQSYELNKTQLLSRIEKTIEHYDMFLPILNDYLDTRYKLYFYGTEMIDIFKKYVD